MKKIKIIISAVLCLALSGCKKAADDSAVSDSGVTVPASSVSEATTAAEAAEKKEYTGSDIMAINWFTEDMNDSEVFTDINDYRYYARTLGLDKDYFLDPEMWEVFYSEEININKDIDEKEYYLIRLDPYKLLDIYAERAKTDKDKLCDSLSVTAAQLYYNWGYNPVSVDYDSKHEKNTAAYSDEEIKIFGAYNGENRYDVMNTHMLVVDNAEGICTYQSTVTNTLSIKRRDALNAFTEVTPLYSGYSENEKSPAYKVNGIGIRAVIPLTLPNAWADAQDVDTGISVMVNVSPFAYGCTDDDILDIMTYINNEKAENEN